jgi:hypothetical protein
VVIASTNQVPTPMMEVYAASKKLATSELDIPEKSDIPLFYAPRRPMTNELMRGSWPRGYK